jgi:hypothetical protein
MPLPKAVLFSVVVAVTAGAAAPLAAQSWSPPDTAAVAGFKDGQTAAQKRPVTLRFVGAFGGGFVAGITAPFGIFGGSTEAFAMTAAGSGIVVAASQWGSVLPPDSLVARANQRSRWYRVGFEEGYITKLRSRRRGAALLGGALGAGAGLGTLYYLLTRYFDDYT